MPDSLAPASKVCAAPADGRLVLRCADAWAELADNDGEVTVTLRRAAGP